MPRRSKPKARKRDWRWYASLALNGAVALSMVLGTIFVFTGAPPPAPPPIEVPTLAPDTPVPTPTPSSAPATSTPVPPSPTPKAHVSDYTPLERAGALNFAVAGYSRDGDAVY